MLEMVYQKDKTCIVLKKGIYKDLNYVIVSYGTHPCCYIFLPENHKYYGKNYDDIDINCHGGLTFSSNDLVFNPILTNNWVIGWDYAHCNDYMGYFDLDCLKKFDHLKCKKWTTNELFEDVKKVIEQLESEE